MQTTITEVITFLNASAAYQERHKLDESKVKYALRKVSKAGMKLHATHAEEVEDLRIEHCSTNKDGVILRGPTGQYEFTKDGARALNKAAKALTDKPVEIAPFVVDAPADLTDDERDAFAGFVLAVEQV